MKVGLLLLILHDVVEKLVGMQLLTIDGDFISPNLDQDMSVIAMVEGVLQTHGVTVEEHVDKIIQALRFAFAMAK